MSIDFDEENIKDLKIVAVGDGYNETIRVL